MKRYLILASAAALCLAGRPAAAQDEACAADAQKFCEGMDPGSALACLKARDAELSAACRESLKSAKPPEDGEEGPGGSVGGPGAGGKQGAGGEVSGEKGRGGKSGPAGRDAQDGRKQLLPCRQSIEKFCKDAQGGRESVLKCLKTHEAELPAACKTAMKGAPAARKGSAGKSGGQDGERGQKHGKETEACKADIDKFCKDTEAGGGRVLNCLKEHEEELSEGCRKMKDGMQQRGGGRGGEEGSGEEGAGMRGGKRGGGQGPGGPGRRPAKGRGGSRGGAPGQGAPEGEGPGGE